MSNISAVSEHSQLNHIATHSRPKTNTVPPLNGHPTVSTESKMTPSTLESEVTNISKTLPVVIREEQVAAESRPDKDATADQSNGDHSHSASPPNAGPNGNTHVDDAAAAEHPPEHGFSGQIEANSTSTNVNNSAEDPSAEDVSNHSAPASDGNIPNRISELLRTRLQAKLYGEVKDCKTVNDDDGDDENNAIRARGGPGGKFICYKQELGSGAYKTVYKGMNTEEAVEVAWNEMKVQKLSSGEKRRLDDEVELLEQLRHKNLVRFFGSWTSSENNKRVFITELMTSGTLKQFLRRTGSPKTKVLQGWCRQILNGLKFMHDKGIIHRDIKCDNIFIEGSTGEVKIGDLGLATILKDGLPKCSVIGTPEFMAPEMYREEYGFPIDIWAFGMCVIEMLTLEYPYSECSNAAQIYRKVTQGIKPAAFSAVTGRHSEVRQKFILLCIANDPDDRASIPTLLAHDFFRPVGIDGQKRIDKKHTTIDVGQINEDGTVEMVLRKHARHDPTSKKKILFNMDVFNEDVEDVVQNMIKEGLIAESDNHSIGNHLRVAVASAKSEFEERSASQSPPSGRAKSAPPHNGANVPDAPPMADFINGFGGGSRGQRRRNSLDPLPEDEEEAFSKEMGSDAHEQVPSSVNGGAEDHVIAQQQEVLDTYAALVTTDDHASANTYSVLDAENTHTLRQDDDVAPPFVPESTVAADPAVMQQQLDHLKVMIDRQERLLATVLHDSTAVNTDAPEPSPSYRSESFSFPLMTTNQVAVTESSTDYDNVVDASVEPSSASAASVDGSLPADEVFGHGMPLSDVAGDAGSDASTAEQLPFDGHPPEDDSATVDAQLLSEHEVVYLSDDTTEVVTEPSEVGSDPESEAAVPVVADEASSPSSEDSPAVLEQVNGTLTQVDTGATPSAGVQLPPVTQRTQEVPVGALLVDNSAKPVETNEAPEAMSFAASTAQSTDLEMPMVSIQDGQGGLASPAISLESIPSQSELELANMSLRDDCPDDLLQRLLLAKIRTGRERDIVDFTVELCNRLRKSEAESKKAKNAEALSGAMEQNFLNAFSLSGPAPVNKGLGHGGKKLL
eukprot:m.1492288 g.1492288  ORF g.1492288 m.1492288 type:complete len:1074 (+) comp25195_c0_seq3:648-3869(+)